MFENETAEEMLRKALEGRYLTRKGSLERYIGLRQDPELGWLTEEQQVANAEMRQKLEEQLVYLETEYAKALEILNPALEEAWQKAIWAAQPIVYLYEPGYEPKA